MVQNFLVLLRFYLIITYIIFGFWSYWLRVGESGSNFLHKKSKKFCTKKNTENFVSKKTLKIFQRFFQYKIFDQDFETSWGGVKEKFPRAKHWICFDQNYVISKKKWKFLIFAYRYKSKSKVWILGECIWTKYFKGMLGLYWSTFISNLKSIQSKEKNSIFCIFSINVENSWICIQKAQIWFKNIFM